MYAFLGNYRVPYYSKLFLFEANGECKDQNCIKPQCSYFMCEVSIEGVMLHNDYGRVPVSCTYYTIAINV